MTNTGKEESTTDGTRSSDVGDTPKTPKVHAKYNSEDPDVTIVSSDGVEVKVHSYRMQAASFVFRDLLSLPQPSNERSPIYFTDPLIEHGWVLESLLDSVYELEVTCLNDYMKARAVIDLAEKWCFTHVIKLIKYHFRNGKCEGAGLSMQTICVGFGSEGRRTGQRMPYHLAR